MIAYWKIKYIHIISRKFEFPQTEHNHVTSIQIETQNITSFPSPRNFTCGPFQSLFHHKGNHDADEFCLFFELYINGTISVFFCACLLLCHVMLMSFAHFICKGRLCVIIAV